jgi:hypothetical protein
VFIWSDFLKRIVNNIKPSAGLRDPKHRTTGFPATYRASKTAHRWPSCRPNAARENGRPNYTGSHILYRYNTCISQELPVFFCNGIWLGATYKKKVWSHEKSGKININGNLHRILNFEPVQKLFGISHR